jgi:DNA-binding SARP family transcriptional activator
MGVLTYLSLEGATHRSKLAGLLWPDSDEKTARNNLAQVLRRLKKTTETTLILGEGTDILSLSNELTADAAQLNVLAFAGDSSFLKLEGELLATYDYDDCPDFADWLFAEREKSQTLRQTFLHTFIQHYEKEGNTQESLHCAELLLQLDPLSEEAHRQLMRQHFLAGDRAAALKAFERCKEILDKELGVEPTTETHTLAAEIEFGSLLPVASKTTTALPLRVLRPPLTGREELWARMETACSKTHPIILRGEPGVGKTRLMRDFLESKGAFVLLQGRPGDSSVTYSTQSRILRQVISLYPSNLEPWQSKELSRILPELGETPEPLTSETDQLRFYEAQASVFQHAFENGMGAIAIDDLQFFDDASFKALMFMLGKYWNKPNAPHLVLAFRSGELSADNETALKDLLQTGSGVMLELTPLSAAQVQELVSSLGIADIETLQQTLHGYTGGNPLFMIETIKSVLESGNPTLSSSAKVQTLLQQRLDKLSQPALRLAWTAAIAQTDFSLELASHVTQQSPFDLAEPLLELEQRQIFMGERFSHDLIFETALASISAPVKTYLHKQTAEFLEKQQASPANIARHFVAANDQNKALPFLQQAVEIAERDFQMIDAATLSEQIANILAAQGKSDEAFEQLKNIRQLLQNSNLHQQSEHVIDRMLNLARTNVQHAESYHSLSLYLGEQKGDFVAAEKAAREGLIYAEVPQLRASLLGDLGAALLYQDRLVEAVKPLREAANIDRDLNSEDLADSLHNLALVLKHLGQYREALKLHREVNILLHQTALGDRLSIALKNYAIVLCDLGHVRQSLEPLREALKLQRKMQGMEIPISGTLLSLGHSYHLICHFEDALNNLQEAFAVSQRNGDPATGYFAIRLMDTYMLLGQHSVASRFLDIAMNNLPRYPSALAPVFREQSHWFIQQGHPEKARTALEKAKEQLAGGQRQLSLDLISLLEALILLPSESLQLSKQVLDHAKDGELKGGLALGALTRCAQACLKLGQAKKALKYSQEAIEMLKTYDPYTFYLGEIHLTHYQALKACKDKTAKEYLKQTLTWLMDVADNHVPSEYRESFLSNNNVNKAILEAARLEGLLSKISM